MPHVLDLFDALVDVFAVCAGLVLIIWIGLQSSRRERAIGWHPAAVLSMLAWLAVFGFALYLIVG